MLLLTVFAVLALLLLGCVVVVVHLVRTRAHEYKRRVHYDVRSDAAMPLGSGSSQRHELAFDGQAFTLPPVEGMVQSAFLELRIQTDWMGRTMDPRITLARNGRFVHHYMERGGAGLRLLNVTAFFADLPPGCNEPVVVSGRHLDWARNGKLVLHVFACPAAAPAAPAAPRTLVIAPHPDDAEIGAWGLISHSPSWVVTVTQGDEGPDLYGAFTASREEAYRRKADVRVWDSLNIVKLAGVPAQRIANLGYFDGTLTRMLQAPEVPVSALLMGETDMSLRRVNPMDPGPAPTAATWQALVQDMVTLLEAVDPQRIVMPHPQLDPHADHQCCTIAMLQALQITRRREGQLYLYTNHLHGVKSFPFGPRDGELSLPHQMAPSALFDAIVSIPMDEKSRLLKQVAIEAQHDLRPAPQAHRPHWARVLLDAIRTPYLYAVITDLSFVRRATRPNELFYVVDVGRAGDLLERTPMPMPRE